VQPRAFTAKSTNRTPTIVTNAATQQLQTTDHDYENSVLSSCRRSDAGISSLCSEPAVRLPVSGPKGELLLDDDDEEEDEDDEELRFDRNWRSSPKTLGPSSSLSSPLIPLSSSNGSGVRSPLLLLLPELELLLLLLLLAALEADATPFLACSD